MDDKNGRLAAALQAAESEGRRQDDRDNARKKKIQAKLMFNRRKLDKDVREYTRDANPILFQSIERIGRSHKFYVGGTPFRED